MPWVPAIITRASSAIRRASSRSSPRISEREPRIGVASEHPVELEVAAARIRAHHDARKSGQLTAQFLGNLIARARALIARREPDVDAASVGAAAKSESAAAAIRDQSLGLRDVLTNHLLELQHDRLGALDASTDWQFGVHADFAFVRLRQQLGREERINQRRRHDGRNGATDDRRPVRERDVQRLAIALVHAFQ